VAVVQYTFTYNLYTEYREWNVHNDKNKKKKKLGSAGCVPSLRVIPWHLPSTGEKAQKNSVRVVEKCPDIPVAVV
jgi:hypothetical protein